MTRKGCYQSWCHCFILYIFHLQLKENVGAHSCVLLHTCLEKGELEITKSISLASRADNAPHHRGKMGSTDDSDRKKRSFNNHNAPPQVKKQALATSQSSEEKKLDPGILQFQNTKLSQQLELQKIEINNLEEKCRKGDLNQARFEKVLMTINKMWNQLQEDMELVVVRLGVSGTDLQMFQASSASYTDVDKKLAAFPPDETFLYRLVESGMREICTSENAFKSLDSVATDGRTVDTIFNSFETLIQSRKNKTLKTLSVLIQALESQRERSEQLMSEVKSLPTRNDVGGLVQKINEAMQLELNSVRKDMDVLHIQHRKIATEAGELRDIHLQDQNEIKRLTGDLEETKSELEQARRKLAGMKYQKEAMNGPVTPMGSSVKVEATERNASQDVASRELKELEAALGEAQTLASKRLQELEEANEAHISLKQQLSQMQASLLDEKFIQQSRSYISMSGQLQLLRTELERCKTANLDLVRERDLAILREKEMHFRAEAGDAAKRANAMLESRTTELELKLQECMASRDSLRLELEESALATGRKETVAELKVMVNTLNKELSMVQSQLNNYKEIAQDVHRLRAEVHSLQSMLELKAQECRELNDKLAAQAVQMEALQHEIAAVRESEQELGFFLDSFERDVSDTREVAEVKQAERRALARVEGLKTALSEHNLELRVKAANDSQANCQQELTKMEVEMSQLRQRLGDSERMVIELKGQLQTKNDEAEVYMSEIETIGQAYEEMQRQNERLLLQVTDRDEYNTQLMSESVKAKQLQTSLMAEKEAMITRMEHANSAVELQKQRVSRLEDQAKAYLEQLGKATEESRHYAAAIEAAKRRSQEADREAAAVRSVLESAQHELEERTQKLADVGAELEREKFKRKRAEEETELLNNKMAKASAHQEKGGMIEMLHEEIKEYKAILKCGVCHDRQKEVVITKCYHLFCSPCIQRNLEIRHRKCPACGIPFGQNDVKNVYI
eukprot:TRINITY_DN7342_c0_g1_i1.p1 TRINITY_DN7342_c0_g1~~TRINITY_DN7342_c0_g1_i1.p1  ORF type:complete len:972 (+),score=239.12 TRINITY_DN7342_c0_g1_i1:12-2927(+)